MLTIKIFPTTPLDFEELDIFDIQIPLNYLLFDISDISTRSSNYSQTIEIPGTRQNNIIFNTIFDINSVSSFNPNKKLDVKIYDDTLLIFTGFLQLLSITNNNGLIKYEIILYGLLPNIVTTLGDSLLSDLDLSVYDHTYSIDSIRNSWDTSIIKDGLPSNFTLGSGYVYPLENRGKRTDSTWTIEMCMPSIYVKTYIDQMFLNLGLTYSSNFFNSDFFKRLVIPFTNTNIPLDVTSKDATLFRAATTTDTNSSIVDANNGTNVYGAINYLPYTTDTSGNGNINLTNGKYTVEANGYYKLSATCNLLLKYYPDLFEGTDYYIVGTTNVIGEIWNVTTNTLLSTNKKTINETDAELTFYFLNPYTRTQSINIVTGDLYLIAGQEIEVRLRYESIHNRGFYWDFPNLKEQLEFGRFYVSTLFEDIFEQGTITITCEDMLFLNTLRSENIAEGNTLALSKVIPTGVKQTDFLLSIIKLFNLYITADINNPNELTIEPRDDFYNVEEEIDWTNKLDRSSIIISPLPQLLAKNYIFKYVVGDEKYSAQYFNSTKKSYGERFIQIDNDFLTETYNVDVIFSNIPYKLFKNKVLPHYITNDKEEKYLATGIKIAYYGGLKSTDTNWTLQGNTTGYTYSNYPYIGHFDDPIETNIDLNWGICDYYNDVDNITQLSNNNLYNKFYKNMIEENSNSNSRLLEGNFLLNSTDINNLNFRTKIRIDNQLYRLYSINEYVGDKVLTKVKLQNINTSFLNFQPVKLFNPNDTQPRTEI